MRPATTMLVEEMHRHGQVPTTIAEHGFRVIVTTSLCESTAASIAVYVGKEEAVLVSS